MCITLLCIVHFNASIAYLNTCITDLSACIAYHNSRIGFPNTSTAQLIALTAGRPIYLIVPKKTQYFSMHCIFWHIQLIPYRHLVTHTSSRLASIDTLYPSTYKSIENKLLAIKIVFSAIQPSVRYRLSQNISDLQTLFVWLTQFFTTTTHYVGLWS